jgi:L-ascorbate metabolism protein UlaG (beta-lactamase superfamily)
MTPSSQRGARTGTPGARTGTTTDAEPGPPTRPGNLDLKFVGHATIRLDLDGRRVVTDPLLRSSLGPLQRHGVRPDAGAVADADVVLVSHGHPDHFDPASLRAVRGAPLVIVPRGLGSAAAAVLQREVVEVLAGDVVEAVGLRIEAVPARHWITPGSPRALPIGFVVRGSRSVYFAGDTGRFPGLAGLAGRVDVALLPVWTWGPHLGPGHLGPRSAAEVLRELGARAAVPIHWGTLYPRRLHHVLRAPLREPGDRFARHAARLCPSVDVRVLRPGDETTFPPPGA